MIFSRVTDMYNHNCVNFRILPSPNHKHHTFNYHSSPLGLLSHPSPKQLLIYFLSSTDFLVVHISHKWNHAICSHL